MDNKKVKAIKDWEVPRTVKDVRALLGSANYYMWLLPHYSDNVSPLTDLTKIKSGGGFQWGTTQQQALGWLKNHFITDVLVTQFRLGWPTILETDASAYAYASVISQTNPETGETRPVVFHSGKFKDAEKRWPIRDRELYAIVNEFEEYRHFLQDNSAGTIKVYSDHRTLATCMDTTTKLTLRLARWMEKPSEYDFTIEYRPGDTMVVPDSMTRRTQDGYEDKFGEYQLLLPHARFNERVLREVETEEKDKPAEDWEGQIEITGKNAFGETAIISPQLDDTHPQTGRNYANGKTGIAQQI